MQRPQQKQRYYNRREPIVEDLREKLNRMRLEKSNQDENPKLPPPDPAYNFLKDPMRGDSIDKNNKKKYNKQDKNEQKPKGLRELLKQPVNINVEISSESGERKCTLDESKTVDIPAAHKQYPKRPQFRRAPGEFHKHHNGKKDLVDELDQKENQSAGKVKEDLHKDKESIKSNTDNSKYSVKKNVSFNRNNEKTHKRVDKTKETGNVAAEKSKDNKSDN